VLVLVLFFVLLVETCFDVVPCLTFRLYLKVDLLPSFSLFHPPPSTLHPPSNHHHTNNTANAQFYNVVSVVLNQTNCGYNLWTIAVAFSVAKKVTNGYEAHYAFHRYRYFLLILSVQTITTGLLFHPHNQDDRTHSS
jgi:hypothetical protein